MPPYRIEWLGEARAHVRAMERATARVGQAIVPAGRLSAGSGDWPFAA